MTKLIAAFRNFVNMYKNWESLDNRTHKYSINMFSTGIFLETEDFKMGLSHIQCLLIFR
jgi:hypothetical protein